eukprot:11003760-Heterocapsa_arctica.AAC.1
MITEQEVVEVPRPLVIGDLELAQLHLKWCGSVVELSDSNRKYIKRMITHKALLWCKVTGDAPHVDLVDSIFEEKIVELVVNLPQ